MDRRRKFSDEQCKAMVERAINLTADKSMWHACVLTGKEFGANAGTVKWHLRKGGHIWVATPKKTKTPPQPCQKKPTSIVTRRPRPSYENGKVLTVNEWVWALRVGASA